MKEEDVNRRRKKNTWEHAGSEKSFKTRERRREGLLLLEHRFLSGPAARINTSNPYLNTQLNALLICYQYLLKSIDYIMFNAVTKISQMHFLHLNSFMFVLVNGPQWHHNPTSPQHRLPPQTAFVNIAVRNSSITVVTLQPTDGLQIQCMQFLGTTRNRRQFIFPGEIWNINLYTKPMCKVCQVIL